MDEDKRNRLIKTIVLIVILAVVLLGVYLIIIVRGPKDNTSGEESQLTAVDQITTLDLSRNYPPTPREVVDLYARIMKVMYRQSYTDAQFDLMASKLEGIFDLELMAKQINWPRGLKDEVKTKKSGDYSIVNYSVAAAEDVVYGTVGGREIANVRCLFAMRHGTATEPESYLFVLRKDDEGRWMILGWEVED